MNVQSITKQFLLKSKRTKFILKLVLLELNTDTVFNLSFVTINRNTQNITLFQH